MVDNTQNPVTDNVGTGADSQNPARMEEFILEYLSYCDRKRKRISLDGNDLRESLVNYFVSDHELFSSWGDNELCGCWLTSTHLVEIQSLVQITQGGVEQVFAEDISLYKLFSSEDWSTIFSDEVHIRAHVSSEDEHDMNNCDDYQRERDDDY